MPGSNVVERGSVCPHPPSVCLMGKEGETVGVRRSTERVNKNKKKAEEGDPDDNLAPMKNRF